MRTLALPRDLLLALAVPALASFPPAAPPALAEERPAAAHPRDRAPQEREAATPDTAARDTAAREDPSGARDEGWDAPRARELARRAVEARRHAYADSTLRSFEADAEGHVYFLGEFGGERRLARADQVALRVRWQAPDRALQLMVGRRHEIHLPARIRYHLDHLTLVLDNFGDRIRLGEGEEVRDVLHPAAPGADQHYEYRLADSLEVRLRDGAFRVYRLEVRPRDVRSPGVVGSLFVERGSGAIARLRCTFTRAAYRDPALQHIRLDLSSALWEGRWWLPVEQEVVIRRGVSWLDFPAAGIIRTRIRVHGYRINEPVDWSLAPGDRVASLPATDLRAYDAWRRPLHAGPGQEAAGSGEELERVRARATDLVRSEALRGIRGMRGRLPRVSDAVRARRAEGVLVGGGATYGAGPADADLWLGYAFGRERPQAELGLRFRPGTVVLEVRAFVDRLADVGPFPAASGVTSSLGLAFEGEDYTDPFFEDGVRLRLGTGLPGGEAWLGGAWRRQQAAGLAGEGLGTSTRPIRPIRPGDLTALEAGVRLGEPAESGSWAAVEGEAGLDGPGDFGYTRLLLRAGLRRADPGAAWGWRLEGAGGAATGRLPPQRLFLLGGRGTLPGHPFRAWGGDGVALVRGEVARWLSDPWVRLRLGGAAGWTGAGGAARHAVPEFGTPPTGGIEVSASLGVGLLFDILRLDLARGVTGGEWALLFSVDPAFWGML